MRIGARAPMHPRRLVSHQPGIGRVMDRLLTCIAAAAGARFACAGFPVSAVFRRRDHGAHMAASWRECAADIAPEARPCAGVRGGARSPGRFDCRGRQERRPRRTRQTHQAHQAHQAHQMRQTANRKPQTPNPQSSPPSTARPVTGRTDRYGRANPRAIRRAADESVRRARKQEFLFTRRSRFFPARRAATPETDARRRRAAGKWTAPPRRCRARTPPRSGT